MNFTEHTLAELIAVPLGPIDEAQYIFWLRAGVSVYLSENSEETLRANWEAVRHDILHRHGYAPGGIYDFDYPVGTL